MVCSLDWCWCTALLLCLQFMGGGADQDCTEEHVQIEGGVYTLTHELRTNTKLIYHCPPNYYPYPALSRLCQTTRRWILKPRSRTRQACKLVECPDPTVLEQGSVYPAEEKYYVGNETTYECWSGYTLRGSDTRVCQSNGKWSGKTPICGRDTDSRCADPGVPAGAVKVGNKEKVTYSCNNNLILVGPSERVCQENGQWTGMEPACYYKHTYDTAQEVAEAFGPSITQSLTELQTEDTPTGRSIRIPKNGTLNIYVAMDISASITKKEFSAAKDAVTKLITKVSSFSVTPNYDILFFSSNIKEVVNIIDFFGANKPTLDVVREELKNFDIEEGLDDLGTDLNLAFTMIRDKMAWIKRNTNEGFLEHRHVIILFSDGGYNVGGSPKATVDKIKNMVYHNRAEQPDEEKRKEYLDIYVFGIGTDIFEEELKPLTAPQDSTEKHFFKLAEMENLDEAFDDIIDEGEVVGLCGLHIVKDKNVYQRDWAAYKYPWKAEISIKRRNCLGSLVSSRFVLTAAHCINFDDTAADIKVYTSDDQARLVDRIYPHPDYNIKNRVNQGVLQFYDYDVALLKLTKKVIFSSHIRPICIPCTQATSDALKLVGVSTCRQQEERLLNKELEQLTFLTVKNKNIEEKDVHAKLGDNRPDCIKNAKHAYGITTNDETVAVTDNFICTGGKDPRIDHISCPGDSGGAVFKEYEHRTIQWSNVLTQLWSKATSTLAEEKYYVGKETMYECWSGYELRGSESRVCQPSGKWSGTTPICSQEDPDSTCADPGVPAGAVKVTYDTDEKVTYSCKNKLILVGSRERVCQENGQWTGVEPACYYKHTYDTAQEVSEAFGSSIKESLTKLQPEDTQEGRKIRIPKNGTLNIYIAMDVSASIKKEKFEEAKAAVIKLITKVSSFSVTPNYEIILFSSEIIEIVDISDFFGVNKPTLDHVRDRLKNFNVEEGENDLGTDLDGAFERIREKMAWIKLTERTSFLDHHHVIIVFTDGGFNVGGSPEATVAKIKHMIYHNEAGRLDEEKRKEYLDIYVFAIGTNIFDEDLMPLTAPERSPDPHYFRLKDIKNLAQTFDDIIDEEEVVGFCGLYIEKDKEVEPLKWAVLKYPWRVEVTISTADSGKVCQGSLVSSRFVLTAAHCIKFEYRPEDIKVYTSDQQGGYNVGGSPKATVEKIKHMVYHNKADQYDEEERKEYLDIYVFGIGSDIFGDELMPLTAPVNSAEKHFFKLADVINLNETFDDIIDEGDAVGSCGLYMHKSEYNPQWAAYKYPCKAEIRIGLRNCLGSLVSSRFVLTAAHCIGFKDEAEDIKVYTSDDNGRNVDTIYLHPDYVTKKAKQGVLEFYDYDVALLKLTEKVDFSSLVRPICIPCTQATSDALKLVGVSTCKQQGDAGGAVFKENELRIIQVAVVSWGVHDMCTAGDNMPRSNQTSRDFHINLFKVVPFLKGILANEDQFEYSPIKFLD